MVSSKKSTKATPSKEANTSTPTKVETPSSYQLESQIQSVNEASNLYAIIRPKQDGAGQYLGIYSVHDNQLLIHNNLSLNDKVSFVKWVDSVTGNANISGNKNTTASSSTIQSVSTNQLLILAKENGEIDIFDLKQKEVNLTLKGEHKSEIIQIIQERDQLISVDKDSTLVHWNLQTGKCLKKWNVGEKYKINQIEYYSQNKKLLTAGDKLQLWELENYSVTKTFTGITEPVDLISSFTKDRRFFITYSNSSKALYLFDIESKTTAPVFKIQSSESIVKILGIKGHSGLQVLALTNKGTLVGWLNTIPQNVYQGQAFDLAKDAKYSPNYKLQVNLDSSEEILPIKYAGINALYNIPIISRGYSNRLGGFESLYVNYTSQKNQNIKLSRGKSDNLSIDKLSAKRRANQLSVDSNTVDGLDPIKTYTNFPHSLAIEMIQYLNSGKLPTKTLVNLISQTVKYNQLELIELHLVNIGIHQLIKILPYTSPDYIPLLFDTLMELLNSNRLLGGRALSLLRAILVYHRNTLMSNGKVIDTLTKILEETTTSQLDDYSNLSRLEGRLRHIQQQIKLREKVDDKSEEVDTTEDQDESSAPEDVLSSKESAFEQGYSAFEDSDEDSEGERDEETFFGLPDDEEEESQLDDPATPTTATPTKKQKKN